MKKEVNEKVNDSILLKKVAEGDQESFKQLYLYYSPRLFRYILTLVKNSDEDAEGIVQELFLKLWIKRESLVAISSFNHYIFRMAKNELINRHIRRKKLQEVIELKKRTQPETNNNSGLERVVFNEYLEAAESLINKMTPQRRKIFQMRTKMNMSIDEISKELNITTSAVKKQLYEAINYLKKNLIQVLHLLLLFLIISLFS